MTTKLVAVRIPIELLEQARSLGYGSDSEVLRAGVKALLGLPLLEQNSDIQALTQRITNIEGEIEAIQKALNDRELANQVNPIDSSQNLKIDALQLDITDAFTYAKNRGFAGTQQNLRDWHRSALSGKSGIEKLRSIGLEAAVTEGVKTWKMIDTN